MRRAYTLVEMMIAMVITLILVWAIAEFYARVGEVVRDGRAMIDQRSSMRTATQRLIADLDLVTVVPAPPIRDSVTPMPGNPSLLLATEGSGYLEIFEGAASDLDPDGNLVIDADADGTPDIQEDADNSGVPDFCETTLAPNLLGDVDDYLGFTMRSGGEPFVGQVVAVDAATGEMTGTSAGAANLAEVAWWTNFNDDPLLAASVGTWEPAEVRSLHRRLLLIRPEFNVTHPGDADYSGPYYFRSSTSDYYSTMQFCDVSVRPFAVQGSAYVYYFANSLADLTRRENRFLHVGTAFPHAMDLLPNSAGSQARWVLRDARRGEDVILSNVLAFDIRVFEPTAVLRYDNVNASLATGVLQPGDAGYGMAVANNHPTAGTGAYVDLNYSRYNAVPTATPFSGLGFQAGLAGTYDTWAASYERDGVDQDGDGAVDPGTNGLDDDGANGVDDLGERETSPPYPTRLRGLEVKVRTYDLGTRQVQQATVGSDFIPE